MDLAIDTNFLRKSALAAALQCADPSDRFFISDTVVVETMKNDRWESTARASFRIISQFRGRIFSATEASLLMKNELNSGRDTTAVDDEGLTRNLRVLLDEIASENDGRAMNHIRKKILAAQTTMHAQQQNHPENLAMMKAIRDDVKDFVDLKAHRRLPADEQRQYRLQFAKVRAQMSVRETALAEGKGQKIGDALAAGRGIILRDVIGLNLLGFKWAANNGLDSLAEKKATNELMDVRHAVIATYCGGILSEETSVIDMRQDILNSLDVEPLKFLA